MIIRLPDQHIFSLSVIAQVTPFEASGGKETATYQQAVAFFTSLAQQHKTISIREVGTTDAGYPLHLVLYSANGNFDPVQWHKNKQVVIMVNNGIHPGEHQERHDEQHDHALQQAANDEDEHRLWSRRAGGYCS